MERRLYLNIKSEEFESFKRELESDHKPNASALVDFQKFAYNTCRTLLKRGVNAEGNPLTDKEKSYLEKAMQEIAYGLKQLKEEHDFEE